MAPIPMINEMEYNFRGHSSIASLSKCDWAP